MLGSRISCAKQKKPCEEERLTHNTFIPRRSDNGVDTRAVRRVKSFTNPSTLRKTQRQRILRETYILRDSNPQDILRCLMLTSSREQTPCSQGPLNMSDDNIYLHHEAPACLVVRGVIHHHLCPFAHGPNPRLRGNEGNRTLVTCHDTLGGSLLASVLQSTHCFLFLFLPLTSWAPTFFLRRLGAASIRVGASDGPVPAGTHRAPSHVGKALAAPKSYGKPLRRHSTAAILNWLAYSTLTRAAGVPLHLWLGYSALTWAARVPLQPSICCLHLGYRRRRRTITAPAIAEGQQVTTRRHREVGVWLCGPSDRRPAAGSQNSQQRHDGRRSDYLATLREAACCSRSDHVIPSANRSLERDIFSEFAPS